MIEEQTSIEETLTSCPGCNGGQIIEESSHNKIFFCKQCLLYFTNPRLTQEFIHENYSYGGYYKNFSPDEKWEGMWKRRTKRLLMRITSGKILDIGSGIGTFLSVLHKFGFDCVGTEISTEAVEKAKQLYGIDLICGYVEDMNFKDESFDIITMWHVFEHLPYPGRCLR